MRDPRCGRSDLRPKLPTWVLITTIRRARVTSGTVVRVHAWVLRLVGRRVNARLHVLRGDVDILIRRRLHRGRHALLMLLMHTIRVMAMLHLLWRCIVCVGNGLLRVVCHLLRFRVRIHPLLLMTLVRRGLRGVDQLVLCSAVAQRID